MGFSSSSASAVWMRCAKGAEPRSEEVSLAVPSWRPSDVEAKALDSLLAARLRAAREIADADGASLLRSYEAYNLLEVKHGGSARNPAILDAWAAYEQWALSTVSALGMEGYLALGARLGEDVIQALDGGVERDVQRLAGRFVEHTRATGLTDLQNRPAAGHKRVLRAALMDRWCRAVIQRHTLDALLTREERELLLRWKLAANPLVLPPRRVQLARELERMASPYPVVEALAARAASDGDLGVALQLYETVLTQRPDDRRIAANIKYLATTLEGENP